MLAVNLPFGVWRLRYFFRRHREDPLEHQMWLWSWLAPALSQLVGAHFTERGYRVAFNDPYKGGFITAHHGRPADHVHAIQIELRRDLYMDEATYAISTPGFERLRGAIGDLLARLETFRP